MSLVEVIISLFLLSIITVIVLGSYSTGLRIWSNQHTDGINHENVRAIIQKLRCQIKSAFPWSIRDENRSRIYFKGGPDSLHFASLVGFSSKRDNGLVHIVSYDLERGNEGTGYLCVREYSWPRIGFPENEDPILSDTVDEIVDFSCRYLVKNIPDSPASTGDTASEEGTWVDSWPAADEGFEKTVILTAVAIDITTQAHNDSKEMFSVTVPVRLTMKGPTSP